MGRTDAENTSSSSKCNSAMSCSYRAATNLGCITTLGNDGWTVAATVLQEAEVSVPISLLVNPAHLCSLKLVFHFQEIAHDIQTEIIRVKRQNYQNTLKVRAA